MTAARKFHLWLCQLVSFSKAVPSWPLVYDFVEENLAIRKDLTVLKPFMDYLRKGAARVTMLYKIVISLVIGWPYIVCK